MGLDLQTFRFVLAAKQSGADFSRTATLGRQNLSVHPDVFRREVSRFGFDDLAGRVDQVYSSFPYADEFLRCLGAETVTAIDASDYEGADIIADMNQPLPPDVRERFSVVIDGGSIEHIFDVPQCLRNIVNLLDEGGCLISINGANNFMGHGFYQFSPEFFFRVFCEQNGFATEEVVLTEVHGDAQWYKATDPAVVRQRLELVNSLPTYIMVRARKIDTVDFPKVIPQQSDYQQKMWDEGSEHLKGDTVDHLAPRLAPRLARRILPSSVLRFLRTLLTVLRKPYRSSHLQPRRFVK